MGARCCLMAAGRGWRVYRLPETILGLLETKGFDLIAKMMGADIEDCAWRVHRLSLARAYLPSFRLSLVAHVTNLTRIPGPTTARLSRSFSCRNRLVLRSHA
jgi:hypothetical protein